MIGRRTPPSTQVADKPKGFDDYELRLGDVMRGERATMSKSLLDVQRELKIKASYIAAIENADVSAFETPGFVAGYVRSYARYLGMDPEWAFGRFCAEANFVVVHGMSAEASGPKSRGRAKKVYTEPLANPNASFVPRSAGFLAGVEPGAVGSLMVLMLIAGGISFGGWTMLQEVQKVNLAPVDQAPGIVAQLDPLAGVGAGQAAAGSGFEDVALTLPGSDALDRLYRPAALDVPVLVARDGPIAAIDPRTVGALGGPVGGDRLAGGIDDPEASESAIDTVVRTVAAEAPGVELLAVRPAWVRVTSADGTVIFEKILDAGERYALPKTEEAPTLHAGNSGSVYFAVNGTSYGPAATGSQVIKGLVLSPDEIMAAYQPSDPTQDSDLAKYWVAEAPTE